MSSIHLVELGTATVDGVATTVLVGPRGPKGDPGTGGGGTAATTTFTPHGSIAATDVQAAIQEVRDEAGAGGAPTTATYLTTTADAGLSAEVVVGATPGGELGGTWAAPTVDATHSGTSHADVQAAAQAASQPLDSDLTAIAALATTVFGRDLLVQASAVATRTTLGLGTAALSASTDFQPVDSDLTAIAALATTAYGRALLVAADLPALRTILGTGTQSASTFLRGDGTWAAPTGGGDALVANPLSQFAATTSAQLKNTISDESGSGALIFGTSPTLVTPVLGVATATTINKVAVTAPATSATVVPIEGTSTILRGGDHSGTNTGDQTSVTGNAGTVTTNANLTGPVTSVGNATAIADGALTEAKVAGLVSDLASKAPLAAPALTGAATVGGQAIVVTNDARLSDTRTPTDDTVTSAKIVDGAIVDADVNASAAIAQSKVATLVSDLAAKLAKASNLSDVASVSTALTNLGFSTYIKTLVDDADAATAKATLGVGSVFGKYGGLTALGHSYTQLGGNSVTVATTMDTWSNFTHVLAASMGVPSDEIYLWGRSGAAITSPTCGDTADQAGLGSILKFIYPNAYYMNNPRPTGKASAGLFVLMYGYNEVLRNAFAAAGLGAAAYKHAFRTAIARCRAGMVYDSRDTTCITFPTGFATTTASPYPVSTNGIVTSGALPDGLACTGPSWRITKASGDKVQIKVPETWGGGVLGVTLVSSPNTLCLLKTAIDAVTTAVDFKGSILGDLGYKPLVAGDIVTIESEWITLGATADAGVTWTGCTRGTAGGGAAAAHAVSLRVVLATSANVTWSAGSTVTGVTEKVSGTAFGSLTTPIGGLGYSADGVFTTTASFRSGIQITVRFDVPASNAGLLLVGTVNGIVGREYVGVDSVTLEDLDPPPVLMVSQPDMGATMPGGGIYFTGATATAYNAALVALAIEFDQAVEVVDLHTDAAVGTFTSVFKATVQTAITSTATTTLKVTPISISQCVINPGSRIRVYGATATETMRVTANDKTNGGLNNGIWSLTVTRNYDAAGAQASIVVGAAVMDAQWLCNDWIHPSDFGHKLIAARCIDGLANITQTTRQIVATGGFVLRRQPKMRDAGYLFSHATRGTLATAAIGYASWEAFEIFEQCVLTAIGLEVTASINASGLCRLGIFTDSQGFPGPRVLDAGTISQAATGMQEITGLWQPMKPGWFWRVCAFQGTGVMATVRAINAGFGRYPYQHTVAGVVSAPTGVSTNGIVAYANTGITGALPGAFTLDSTVKHIASTTTPANTPFVVTRFAVPIRD